MRGRVLVIAGSDSGAGAGIQADLKTIMALGGYATTAITAVTAQNTLGVQRVQGLDPGIVRQQMVSVLDDIGADVVKIGMLLNAAIIETVAATLVEHAPNLPLVLDPVMVAKGGASLLDEDAVAALRSLLFPRATILTPNIPEAEALLGRKIPDLEAMRAAATDLRSDCVTAVLLKGGHLAGDQIHDVLATPYDLTVYSDARLLTDQTHGTGCTLASAIAVGLAQNLELAEAVGRARAYVRDAIETAPGLGKGQGPLDHGCRL